MPGGPVGADHLVVVTHLPTQPPGPGGSPGYPGTPREFWGLNADEWPGASRGAGPQVADLVTRLRTYLAQPEARE
jgi:hypothetical protein